MEAWWQAQLWNPHQQPTAANLSSIQSATIPNSYKFQAYGDPYVTWVNSGTPVSSGETTHDTGAAIQMDPDSITFSLPDTIGSVFYASPVGLTTTILPTLAAHGPDVAKMTPTTIVNYTNNKFIGFWMGSDSTFTGVPDSSAHPEGDTFVQLPTGATFCLGWTDSFTGGFHPYSYMTMVSGSEKAVQGYEKGDDELGSAWPTTVPYGGDSEAHYFLDPRTFRFADLAGWVGGSWQTTMFPKVGGNTEDTSGWGRPLETSNFIYNGTGPSYYETPWESNAKTPIATSGFSGISSYYADPDGVVRPADGLFASGNASGTGDGMPLFTSAASPTGSPTAAGDAGGNVQHGRRPVILNRPFRSLAELGYVFRDLPFKTLDFFSTSSADAALLDVFSLTDESKVSNNQISSVVAGQVFISNSPGPVLQAILSGGSKKDLDPTYNLGTETKLLTTNLGILMNPVTGLRIPKPILNRSAIVTTLSQIGSYVSGSSEVSAFTASGDKGNKAYMEAPERALADITQTRTWNLLVDVIAQSGQLATNATTLDNFVVQGERRYWLHIAIDRYTGKIVAQQLEPVYE